MSDSASNVNEYWTNNADKSAKGLAGLKFVDDPEVGLNVVDLGLIYKLDFPENEQKVICTMTFTTEFCPMGESILENVTQSLQLSFPDDAIEVNLTFDPPWSWEAISPEGREFLGG